MAFLAIIFAYDTPEAMAKSKRGFLGVTVEEMTPSMRKENNVSNRSGLLVIQVIHRSPADDAGIREGDVIVKYDGKEVGVIDDFVLMVRNTEPENNVKIDIVRDGEDKQIEVVIEKKRRRGNRFYSWHGDEHAPHAIWLGRPQLGVKVHELNTELTEYFDGTENGVLVLSVTEDSPAEAAGIKAGDIIIKIDNEIVESYEELIEILSDYDGGEEVELEYIRKGRTETATVTLEENSHFSENFFHRFAPKVEIHGFDHDQLDGKIQDKIRVILGGREGDMEI